MRTRIVVLILIFSQLIFGWGWLGGGIKATAANPDIPSLGAEVNVLAIEPVSNDSATNVCNPSPKLDPCETFILIVDRDPNQNSGSVMVSTIEEMGLTADYMTFVPLDMSMYNLVFVCLGVYEDNHVLSYSEGQKLALYLNSGGNLYMEGGDTWFYDPPTVVHSMFNIYPVEDGLADLNVVTGLYGTFAQGMSFNYSGDNSWIDRINAIPPAYELFKNQYPFYITGVAYDEGTYKTIGVSHEFGGFEDGLPPSTKLELMNKYLEFFDIPTSLQSSFYANQTEVCLSENVNFFDLSIGEINSWNWMFEGGIPATSTYQNPTVVYNDTGWYDITLIVSDGVNSDTLTKEGYIQVEEMPEIPGKPEGPEVISSFPGEMSEYTTPGSNYSSTYSWSLEPEGAGLLNANGANCIIDWTDWWQGTASLKVKGVNGCGESDFSEELVVGCYMTDVAQKNKPLFRTYPNPSNGRFCVESNAHSEKAIITIINIYSEVIYFQEMEMPQSNLVTIDLSHVAYGIYFVKFVSGNSEIIEKIVIR